MEGPESFQLLEETHEQVVNSPWFLVLIENFSILVSTIRLPSPFSERQV